MRENGAQNGTAPNPYESTDASDTVRVRRFPWYSTIFIAFAIFVMLTILVVVSEIPINPNFALLSLKLLSMSFVPAFIIAAVAQLFSSSSTFKNKFYFLLFICNLIVGGFVLSAAVYGALRELDMLPK